MSDDITLFSNYKDRINPLPAPKVMRKYQGDTILNCARAFKAGFKSPLVQLATGSGKTVILCAIAAAYHKKAGRAVLILVHREELLNQTLKTLWEWHGISGFALTASTRKPPYEWPVYVAMTETLDRRAKKWGNIWIDQIGMLIVDEAHLAIHQKTFKYFENCLRLGFSATPISSSKKNPLKNHFDELITGIDIPELIQQKALCSEICYSLPAMSSEELEQHIGKNGDYDDDYQGEARSTGRQLKNTLKAYQDKADGTKCVIFNANVDHSKKVAQTFIDAGYPCRHLDGETGKRSDSPDIEVNKNERKEILEWFHETPGAILCNVAVATTGFDEPTIQTVIFNKDTKSLPLWLQALGRGGRIIPGIKETFVVIDMGDNVARHGMWSTSHDWQQLFKFPGEPSKKLQAAPYKHCKECDAILPASATQCKYCGADLSKADNYDGAMREVVLIDIDVKALYKRNNEQGRKDYATFFQIGIELARKSFDFEELIPEYYRLGQMFCDVAGKEWNTWHKEQAENSLRKEISKRYGNVVPFEQF